MAKNASFQAVIIAAGESSRFWPLNEGHKSLLPVMGKPLICWTIAGLVKAGVKDIIIVVGPNSAIEKEIGGGKNMSANVSYVVQPKPIGTGNAIFQAKNKINRSFIVLHPYKYYIEDIASKIIKDKKLGRKTVLVGSPTNRPQDFGILRFDKGGIVGIIENPAIGKEPSGYRSVGIYGFEPEFFSFYVKTDQVKEDNLIDTINLLIKNDPAGFIKLNEEPLTLKYPWNVFPIFKGMIEMMSKRIISRVTDERNQITGKVIIGKNVKIGMNTVIEGPCYIGNNVTIGANNIMRGPFDLEDGVITGAFTEIKNCFIGHDTHIHSGYFGDSIIGENCRVGAGFTSANRRIGRDNIFSSVKGEIVDTKLTSFGCIIGSGSRLGVNVSTMPGVFIGRNAIIGPGTIVKENVENNTTYYSEFKTIKKKNNA
ncbi:MAG: sugar phosphate nucleotidyltransferase [bacterium]